MHDVSGIGQDFFDSELWRIIPVSDTVLNPGKAEASSKESTNRFQDQTPRLRGLLSA